MRFLVTAGNTREPIDHVRDWGNIFTGNTGLSIARALSRLGDVDLLTSNRAHLAELAATQGAVHAHSFTTHADLKQRLAEAMTQNRYDAVYMTAAVADYRPVRTFAVVEREADPHDPRTERWIVRDAQAGKVKSDHNLIAVLGQRTEKLVDLFRTEWAHRGLLVKFKLEVGLSPEELLRVAEESRRSSRADYLVANTLDMVTGHSPGAYLLHDAGHEWVNRPDLPARMLEIALKHARA